MRTKQERAEEFWFRLDRSVDLYFADDDRPAFKLRQIALWDAIEAAGVKDEVLEMFRHANAS